MPFFANRRERRDEDGAVALIVAVSMVALFVVAGLVLNVGLARTDKLTNKSYTDAAAAAGIRATDVGDGTSRPYLGVCTALAYLRVNDPELSGLTTIWHTGAGAPILEADPCASGSAKLQMVCVPNDPTTWAWFSGKAKGGRITVDIKAGYVTPDPAFDPAGSGDNSANGGCDQLAVIIHESEQPGLGNLASKNNLVTADRSVARAIPSNEAGASVALLILDRTDCPAVLVNSVNTHVEVQGIGTQPGVIHSDSDGSGSGCSTNTKVLTGKFSQGIRADAAETGSLGGIITEVALTGLPGAVAANANDGSANVCAQTSSNACASPTGRATLGRGQVDNRYLAPVKAAMASAQTIYNSATAPAGYTTLTGSNCNNLANSAPYSGSVTATKVWVNCPSGVTFKTFTFPNATEVAFNGTVGVQSSGTLSMPNANRVYIKGAAGSNGLNVQGNFQMNMGTAADCTARAIQMPAPTRARLVIGNGAFMGGAQSSFHMCATTVLMSDGWQSSCPPPTVATIPGPAPTTNACNGSVRLGGGGAMDWKAPNSNVGPSGPTDWADLEDLALWTETSASDQIGGSGSLLVSGVFFMPNGNPVTIKGNGSQTIGMNAQFVARSFVADGNGLLLLRPQPNDVVTIPPPPSFGLVR